MKHWLRRLGRAVRNRIVLPGPPPATPDTDATEVSPHGGIRTELANLESDVLVRDESKNNTGQIELHRCYIARYCERKVWDGQRISIALA